MKAPLGKNPDPPEPPKEKTYLVCGPSAVHGAQPGEKVRLALDPKREKALIEGGHLRLHVPASPPKPREQRERSN